MTGWPAGLGCIVLDRVESTNAEMRRRVEIGKAGPLWVATRHQTAGRGRLGRVWEAGPGNLAATLLLPFRGEPAEAARLSFLASLAVGDLVSQLAPDLPVTLKWPNDVLLSGAKVSGILLENLGPGDDGRLRVAIGIGVNLAHHPAREDTRWPATSIAAATGRVPDFDVALAGLATNMNHWLDVLDARSFEAIRAAWLARADQLGEVIEARLPGTVLRGRFVGIGPDGALVLETPDGTRHIAAGEVYWGAG